MALTKSEKRKLKKSKRLEAKNQAKIARSKSRKSKLIASASIAVLVIGFFVVSAIINNAKPGYYDDFARCLSEKGMVIYGAEWCTYTAAQKQMFGKSFEFINYQDYTTVSGISTTPTWEFENERYPRVQTFEKLSELTDCELPPR